MAKPSPGEFFLGTTLLVLLQGTGRARHLGLSKALQDVTRLYTMETSREVK